MRDIITRLANVQPECTCDAWFGEPHEELCILQVVRDAETEILRLKAELEIAQILGEHHE